MNDAALVHPMLGDGHSNDLRFLRAVPKPKAERCSIWVH
jgi:hypothetical protein